jgi:DNA-directed RNA polymerase alpha subunit
MSSSKCVFQIENADVGVVNAIRRTILSEVESIAIVSDMTFIENNTPLHNEFMAHRISLIPLHFTEDEVEEFDPENYRFVLNVTNTTNTTLNVTSKDIKVFDRNDNEIGAKSIFPPFTYIDPTTKSKSRHYILITKLKQNECINVEFRAAKGCGAQHAKWSPVSVASYVYTTDMVAFKKARTKVAKADLHYFDTIEKQRIVYKDKNGNPNKFTFTIESECRLSPDYIFNKAVEKLIQNLRQFPSHIKKVTTENDIDILEFQKETDTVANIIHVIMMNNYVNKQKTISYAGFYKEHALKQIIIFKLKFIDSTKKSVEGFIASCVKDAINMLSTLLNKENC